MSGLLEVIFGIFTLIYEFYEQVGDFVFSFFITYSRSILDLLHIIFDTIFKVLLYFTVFLVLGHLLMAIYLLFNKRKDKEIPVDNNNLPYVTIQIPTYNELAAINCAEKCLEFDYPKDKYEIIIGDDSSDNNVSRKINEFASKFTSVKVTRRGSNRGFKPANLNHMLSYSKGDYIIIFDSDFLPNKDFLRRIIAPFVHSSDVAAVQARWVTNNFSQNIVSVVGGSIPLLTHYLALPFLNRLKGSNFIAGSAEAIKKKELIKLGGWKNGSLTEDIEFSLRLSKKGKKIVYLEDLHCQCEAPFTVRDLSKQQMRWAYGVIVAIKSHFSGIILNKKLSFVNKLNIFLLLSGYILTLLFFLLGITGFLSIITHRPELINWGKLITETSLNFLITSFVFTTSLTLVLGNQAKEIPRMLVGSFTVGIVLIFIVTLGVFKAIFNRPMQWFMLAKKGNMTDSYE